MNDKKITFNLGVSGTGKTIHTSSMPEYYFFIGLDFFTGEDTLYPPYE